MDLLLKLFSGYLTFLFLINNVSLIYIIFTMVSIVFTYQLYHIYKSQYKFTNINKPTPKKLEIITLAIFQTAFISFSILQNEIKTINYYSLLLFLYFIICTSYTLNILEFLHHNQINNILNNFIYPSIISIGYFFYIMMPNEIVKLTGIGHQNFSEFYLVIISFIIVCILLLMILSVTLPILILIKEILTIYETHEKYKTLKIKIKTKAYFTTLVAFICLISNTYAIDTHIKKFNTDDFISNIIVQVYFVEKPTRCRNKYYHYPEDKFMFIDENNLSVAYLLGDRYIFSLDKCQKE